MCALYNKSFLRIIVTFLRNSQRSYKCFLIQISNKMIAYDLSMFETVEYTTRQKNYIFISIYICVCVGVCITRYLQEKWSQFFFWVASFFSKLPVMVWNTCDARHITSFYVISRAPLCWIGKDKIKDWYTLNSFLKKCEA